MYLCSRLHGQGTSFCPAARGMPTECKQGTKPPPVPSASSAARPMRAMMRMLTATYAESVSCTPISDSGEPIGPIEKGTT